MTDEGKKKMGRPAKPPEEKALARVWVYLPPAEKEELDDYLRYANISVSRLLRNLLTEKKIIGKKKGRSPGAGSSPKKPSKK